MGTSRRRLLPHNAIFAELHRERNRQNISLRALAAEIGTDAGNLSRWERNIHEPSISDLVRWCTSLGKRIRLANLVE
jgi:transcriptional regulator with XRE-family HTH domain